MVVVSSSVKNVFVCSAARSGSTIADILLGGHRQIASTGELVFLGRSLSLNIKCSCNVPIRQCDAWHKVFSLIEARHGVNLYENPYGMEQWLPRAFNNIDHSYQNKIYLGRRKLLVLFHELRRVLPTGLQRIFILPRALRNGVKNTYKIYSAIRDAWGADMIIDSSKNIRQACELYRYNPETFRIIFLVRDGRGVLHSGIKSGYGLKQSLNSWFLYNKRTLNWLNQFVSEDHVFYLKYERLVGDTEQVMREICDFLGLNFDVNMTNLSYGTRHIFEGNDTRFFRDRPLKLDEKWKNDLNQHSLTFFNQHAAELNKKFGY